MAVVGENGKKKDERELLNEKKRKKKIKKYKVCQGGGSELV